MGVSGTAAGRARIGGIQVLGDRSQGVGRGRQTIGKPRRLSGEGSSRLVGWRPAAWPREAWRWAGALSGVPRVRHGHQALNRRVLVVAE